VTLRGAEVVEALGEIGLSLSGLPFGSAEMVEALKYDYHYLYQSYGATYTWQKSKY
jgi:hypothetical protein